ncbi:MAG: LuxR C-terminal-related transcriptional regulator [Gammaproteobacteria bacterium]
MFNFFEDIISNVHNIEPNIQNLFNGLEKLNNMWMYWKDLDGNYLGCNDAMAEKIDLVSHKDIVGRSVFDIHSYNPEEAKIYAAQDKNVLEASKPLIFQDTATLPHTKINFLVLKIPLFEHKLNRLKGTLGFSFYLSEEGYEELSQLEASETEQTIENPTQLDLNLLTLRQLECFNYLKKGLSSKQIAQMMGISSRTVDSYIEAIKVKFNCNSRKKLLCLALQNYRDIL